MFFSKARRARSTGGVQTNDNGGLFVTFEDVIESELTRIDKTYNVNGKTTRNGSEEDAIGKGIGKSREDAQQLGERAGEYYESTSSRAGELYTQASEKVAEVAKTAREHTPRQIGSVAAAIDAGKKAYQEEKRKRELSGRVEADPQYTEKTN